MLNDQNCSLQHISVLLSKLLINFNLLTLITAVNQKMMKTEVARNFKVAK